MIKRLFISFVSIVGLLSADYATAQTAPTPVVYFSATLRDGVTVFRDLDRDTVCKMRVTDRNAAIPNDPVQFMSSAGLITNSTGTCYGNRPPATTAIDVGSWRRNSCTQSLPYFDPAVGCVAAQPPAPPLCHRNSTYTGTYNTGTVYPDGRTKTDGYSPFDNGGIGTDGQCEVLFTDVESCQSYPPSDISYCTYTGTRTGNQRNPSTEAPAPNPGGQQGTPKPEVSPPSGPGPSGSCPVGTVQAGVSGDGVPICMGQGKNPKPPVAPPPKVETSKSEATPDGGTKTTNTTITSNSDGSKTTTTTTTTTAPDGTKTTTVAKDTTAAASGAGGKDESAKDEEKYDLCKQNPMLNICRNSTVAGVCGEITCQGDAIQCATLRAAAAMECRDKKNQQDLEASPLISSGNSILSGADKTADNFRLGTSVDMSKQNLDQSGFVSGTCLANRSFTVSGHTVEISFARVCESIQPLRAIVMACAFIISYLIVSRSVIQA